MIECGILLWNVFNLPVLNLVVHCRFLFCLAPNHKISVLSRIKVTHYFFPNGKWLGSFIRRQIKLSFRNLISTAQGAVLTNPFCWRTWTRHQMAGLCWWRCFILGRRVELTVRRLWVWSVRQSRDSEIEVKLSSPLTSIFIMCDECYEMFQSKLFFDIFRKKTVPSNYDLLETTIIDMGNKMPLSCQG